MPNMSPKKAPMPSQDPNVRNKNFLEVATGYTEEVAIEEAQRCLNCKHTDTFLFFVVIEIQSVKRNFLLLQTVYYFFVSYVVLIQYLICVILVVSHNG